MSVTLQRGANTSLQAAIAEYGSRLRVVLEWAGDHPAHPSVDAVAFLLTESGKVRSDSDMIFYNHPTEAGGFIIMAAGENVARGLHVQAFTLDLDKVPEGIERVCFCLTLQSSGPGGLLYLSQLGQTALRVLGGPADTELVRADFNMGDTQETALIMGEVYRRKGEWKVKCVAQGFASGLGALAESYGVVVAEAAQAVGQMIPPDAAPAPQMPKSATPSQHFQKPPGGFGEVQVILNWGVPPVPGAAAEPLPAVAAAPKGFLGNLMGANKGAPAAKVHKTADLDLCCLFELTDGYRGIVQALGNNFGGFQTAPYVELMGDERQGSGVQAEIMRLNGKRWDEIRRLLFFAMIFEGIPNWAKANGRARILVPEQVPVSVRLDMATMDQRVCSIALIENEGGKMVIHKRVETFKNPRELDQHYGWGLRWSAGTKD